MVRGADLWVANAGDSRCVCSRRGLALALSHDHKPTDDEELQRISRVSIPHPYPSFWESLWCSGILSSSGCKGPGLRRLTWVCREGVSSPRALSGVSEIVAWHSCHTVEQAALLLVYYVP